MASSEGENHFYLLQKLEANERTRPKIVVVD
jgi:hypothetical protein